MTTQDFPYLSEEETMQLLNYNKTSMKNLRNSKALTRHQIGHRFFYDKKEVIKLIEDSKVYEQDANEYQKYIVSVNKLLSSKELNAFERRFTMIYAEKFLNEIQNLMPEKNRLSYREKLLMEMCFANKNFKDVAERFNLTSQRVGDIFHKTLRITRRVCLEMKNNYEKNYIPLQEENELLKKQNYELKSQLHELNKDAKILEEYTDSVLYTSIYDLDISVRLMNVLKVNDLITLGDVIRCEANDFLRFRNFGGKSLSELKDLLETYGLKLKGRK